MDVLYARCCGLDLHKQTIVACLLTPGPGGERQQEVRRFGTMTAEIAALGDWLAAAGCTHVAMESTGVYWKPVYNLLEERFTLVLVNPQHMKAVPGRKTDVRDCEWLADLLQHGLVRGSYVPDQAQRELRELTRYRTALVRERTAAVNRLQKTLEGANIKLSSVVSDITGRSAREMLAGLVAGDTDAAGLADLARGRLREKLERLEQALVGRMGAHQRFLVAEQLAHLDELDERIGRLTAEVGERLRPFAADVRRLESMPGVGRRTAEVLVAEIGTDMGRFPTARHLASWAGMCPGNNESAGKHKSGRTRKGSPWLRSALVEAGQAAGRSKKTYLGAQYRRLAVRRGAKRAAVAVGHTLLIIAYHVLHEQSTYTDLGPDYFDQRDRERLTRQYVRRLQHLGHTVVLDPPQAAA